MRGDDDTIDTETSAFHAERRAAAGWKLTPGVSLASPPCLTFPATYPSAIRSPNLPQLSSISRIRVWPVALHCRSPAYRIRKGPAFVNPESGILSASG